MTELEQAKKKLLEELVGLSNDVQGRHRELDELCRNRSEFLAGREEEEKARLAALLKEISDATAAIAETTESVVKAIDLVTASRTAIGERRKDLSAAIDDLERREREFAAERSKAFEELATGRRALETQRDSLRKQSEFLETESKQIPSAAILASIRTH